MTLETMTVPTTGCPTASPRSSGMLGSSSGCTASNKLESHRRSPTCKSARARGEGGLGPCVRSCEGCEVSLKCCELLHSLCVACCAMSCKLHACQHGDRPGVHGNHRCRAWLNASHPPRVPGQILIRASIFSKTVYTKTVYNFFDIYVVLVFLYPALLCLN